MFFQFLVGWWINPFNPQLVVRKTRSLFSRVNIKEASCANLFKGWAELAGFDTSIH